MMPSTLSTIQEYLKAATLVYPEQRLCQIIVNATGKNDPFYVTDEELIDSLQKYISDGMGNPS